MASTRRGLALAGGGPLGAIYEIGALVALDEALEGFPLAACDVYVGVSSGSFFASGLANGLTPRAMFESFIENTVDDPFDPAVLLRPAFTEFAHRALGLVPLLLSVAGAWFTAPTQRGFMAAAERLGQAVPTGILDNGSIVRYLARLFAAPGRTDDFRRLTRRLFIVATDLDTGEVVPFGAPGLDDVPISVAVAASAALPGLYPPVSYGGRSFVDGALKKTLHASVALRDGVQLLLCINPLVPFNAALAERRTGVRPARLVEYGLPLVLSQTFRAIIHSRMHVAMGHYATEFPGADIVLFEPAEDDPEMFFVNVLSYADRRRLCEHAYQYTRRELLRRYEELAPVFARHGVSINRAVLEDTGHTLVAPAEDAGLAGAMRALDTTLDRLADEMAAQGADHREFDEAVSI
ncbi:MAG: patatin-like phospholipase family protein [Rhodospirillales bacterium]